MSKIKTKDVEEAAYYWIQEDTKFYDVELHSRKNGDATVVFIFDTSLSEDEIKQLRNNFYNHESSVEPKAYNSAQVDLRNIMHNELRKQKEDKV